MTANGKAFDTDLRRAVLITIVVKFKLYELYFWLEL